MRTMEKRKQTLNGAVYPYKVLWGWIKSNSISFTEFSILLRYIEDILGLKI